MIDFPERIENKLKENSEIHAFTLMSVTNLKPWLDANTTVFFPEYTDHSFQHLNEVLATAVSLVTDDSWEYLTAEDASAMVISVLLHDCGMHITEDGFYTLINDVYPSVNSQYVGEEPKWSVMWSDYIAEAKRFNTEKLKAIFNDTKPISNIPDDKVDLTNIDKLLIGEFIRRHHARIAHEIVFNGVPGANGNTLLLAENPRKNFLDLCGFIARSHNMSLRQAVDRIDFNKRRLHLNSHVPFLMAVLRISDYIQVQPTRAPSKLLNVKSLISPISKGEWKKHEAILEINHADQDPEALFIDAEPQDPIIFEELRWLFGDIQRELDEVWAVLGEVYGRFGDMSNLAINIRRIRSSLDDIDKYIRNKSPDFIPKVLKFRTADSEMMELLIAPLYGNKPEIGIRELVQNSVDACLELEDIYSKQGLVIEKPEDYDVCVSVIEHADYGEVIVEDYGVGMTLDIIENYFLNIGASFRNSDRWKKTHETDGSSDIHRTGRFGIGLLAAYLLGDELEVETRHVSCLENEGLKFKCSRGSKSVTIAHTNCHVGTRISIKTSKVIVNYLKKRPKIWDWYCLSTPKVKRKLVQMSSSNEECVRLLPQNIVVPQSGSDLKGSNWSRVDTKEFEDVLWSYEGFDINDDEYYSKEKSSIFVCNGIFINSVKYNSNINFLWNIKNQILTPKNPTIVVYDQDGLLPLNIQRSSLTYSNSSFISSISKDVTRKLMESFFKNFNKRDFLKIDNTIEKTLGLRKLDWEVRSYRDNYISAFIFSKQGLTFINERILTKAKLSTFQIVPFKDRPVVDTTLLNSVFTNFSFVKIATNSRASKLDWVRNYFELSTINYHRELYEDVFSDYIFGSRLFIRIDDYNEVCKPTLLPKRFQKLLKVAWSNDKWLVLENKISGKLPELLNPEDIIKFLEKQQLVGTIFHYLDWDKKTSSIIEKTEENKYSIADAWLELNNGNAYFRL